MANPPYNDGQNKPEEAKEQDISKKGIDLFFGEKERAFFDSVGREIINGILKESFIFYGIDYAKTNTHKLYGEAKKKVYRTPVEIFGRINVEVESPEYMTPGGIIKKGFGKITAEIFRSHLNELKTNPKIGDYMYFKGHYYEIVDDGSSNIGNEQSYAGDIVFSIKIVGIRVKADVFNAK
jgi:hypothetical protein